MTTTLTDFRDYVVTADLSDHHVYAELVRKVIEVLNLTPGEVSAALRVSRPTVTRWMNGITAPHEGMREPMRRFALRKIDEALPAPIPQLGIMSDLSLERISARVRESRTHLSDLSLVTDDMWDRPAVTWYVKVALPDGSQQVVSDWDVLLLVHGLAAYKAQVEVLEMQLEHYRKGTPVAL